MAKFPTNTPLREWYSTWLLHECDSIIDKLAPKRKGEYMMMSADERRKSGWPHTREEAITFILKHRPHLEFPDGYQNRDN